jgi:hypothetical protein
MYGRNERRRQHEGDLKIICITTASGARGHSLLACEGRGQSEEDLVGIFSPPSPNGDMLFDCFLSGTERGFESSP